MPTTKQLTSAKKKLRKVAKPNNAPRIPSANTLRVIAADPKVRRNKEMRKLITEMVNRYKVLKQK